MADIYSFLTISAKLTLNSFEQKKQLDTGAGFYLDEEDLIEEEKKEANLVEDPRMIFFKSIG